MARQNYTHVALNENLFKDSEVHVEVIELY